MAVTRSLRSMAAGVSTDPPNCGSRGHGSLLSQLISVRQIYRNLAPARRSRRQPVQNELELLHHAVGTGRAGQAGPHPARWPGRSPSAADGRLAPAETASGQDQQQRTGSDRGGWPALRHAHAPGCPAIAWWQAGSDPRGQVLDGAPPGHTPGLLVFQQLSHRVELGLGEIDGGAGRCPHRRLRSSVRRSLLNQRWAAPASASAAQFTGTATAAGPSPAPSSHEITTGGYLPGMRARRSAECHRLIRPRCTESVWGSPTGRPDSRPRGHSDLEGAVSYDLSGERLTGGGYPDGRPGRRGQELAEPPQVRGISVGFPPVLPGPQTGHVAGEMRSPGDDDTPG